MSEEYEPLRIDVKKFRGKREALLELFSVIEIAVNKVPENPDFVFKLELKEALR